MMATRATVVKTKYGLKKRAFRRMVMLRNPKATPWFRFIQFNIDRKKCMDHEKRVDLHTHSTYSDGVHAPETLVEIALEKNLAAISLCDHDCLDGFDELSRAAQKAGIEHISGVELSCIYRDRDLHVLGYGVDTEDRNLRSLLTRFIETREKRGLKIMEKLSEMGIHIDADAVLASAGAGALGRPHIADALLKAKHVKSIPEAFEKYIGEDCPAYVEKYKMNPKEAVENIHAAGGLAFVAHPGFYMEDLDAFETLLDDGFDGIEVLHPNHNSNAIQRLGVIAKRRGLLVSGGSDFHGFAGRDAMGEPMVPYEIFATIKEHLAAGT
jgi:predicted metal-dependent phosphoesterase TrpH